MLRLCRSLVRTIKRIALRLQIEYLASGHAIFRIPDETGSPFDSIQFLRCISTSRPSRIFQNEWKPHDRPIDWLGNILDEPGGCEGTDGKNSIWCESTFFSSFNIFWTAINRRLQVDTKRNWYAGQNEKKLPTGQKCVLCVLRQNGMPKTNGNRIWCCAR